MQGRMPTRRWETPSPTMTTASTSWTLKSSLSRRRSSGSRRRSKRYRRGSRISRRPLIPRLRPLTRWKSRLSKKTTRLSEPADNWQLVLVAGETLTRPQIEVTGCQPREFKLKVLHVCFGQACNSPTSRRGIFVCVSDVLQDFQTKQLLTPVLSCSIIYHYVFQSFLSVFTSVTYIFHNFFHHNGKVDWQSSHYSACSRTWHLSWELGASEVLMKTTTKYEFQIINFAETFYIVWIILRKAHVIVQWFQLGDQTEMGEQDIRTHHRRLTLHERFEYNFEYNFDETCATRSDGWMNIKLGWNNLRKH